MSESCRPDGSWIVLWASKPHNLCWLVEPSWTILVNWDDSSQYMEKLKKFQATNQIHICKEHHHQSKTLFLRFRSGRKLESNKSAVVRAGKNTSTQHVKPNQTIFTPTKFVPFTIHLQSHLTTPSHTLPHLAASYLTLPVLPKQLVELPQHDHPWQSIRDGPKWYPAGIRRGYLVFLGKKHRL